MPPGKVEPGEVQLIRSTPEHPFYVYGKAWTPLGELKPDDWIRTDDGWVEVNRVEDPGRYETVYNLRVADFHTYFVGDHHWAYSVWAHNADCLPTPRAAQHGATDHQGEMNRLAALYQGGTPHPRMPPGVAPVRAEVRTNQAPLNPTNPAGPPLRAGTVSPNGQYNVRPDVQILGTDGRVYVTEVTRGGSVAAANYEAVRQAQLQTEYGTAFGGYNQVVLPP
jgi:hypothetical protein